MDKFGLKQQQHRVAAPTMYQRFTTWWYSKFTYPRNTGGLLEYTGESIAAKGDRSLFDNGAGSGRLRDGKGKLRLTSYDTIDGEWKRDYPIGQMTWEERYSTYNGKLIIETYERYYYRFKKSKGTITYHDTGDVDTYTGTFGYRTVKGNGTIKYRNGNVYKGEVKVDVNSRLVPDGEGMMTYEGGTKKQGIWESGLLIHGTAEGTAEEGKTVSPSTLAIPRGSISFGNPVVEPPPAPIARVAPSPSPSSQTIFENPVLSPSSSPIFAMVAPPALPSPIAIPSAPPAPPSPIAIPSAPPRTAPQRTSGRGRRNALAASPIEQMILPLPPTTPPLPLPPPPPRTAPQRTSGRGRRNALVPV